MWPTLGSRTAKEQDKTENGVSSVQLSKGEIFVTSAKIGEDRTCSCEDMLADRQHTDTQTHRHTDRQTHRHTDTQTHRQTDIQTYRQTDRHTHTQT